MKAKTLKPEQEVGIILGHLYIGYGFTSRQKKRMDKALKLIQQGMVTHLMTTGGKGMWNKTTPTMGVVARNYLSKNGISTDHIFVEDQSVNTFQNAQYALQIMQEQRFTAATIITSVDHMPRARRIFQKVFPSTYTINFVISDYFCGFWSLFDLLWNTLGMLKYALRQYTHR